MAYEVTGLSLGTHTFHVHEFGDLFGGESNALSTGGHFVGDCAVCRPDEPQEVGRLGNGTHLISATDDGGVSTASGEFVDNTAKLNGVNSIVGRSIVIHGIEGDSGARAAMCVIGGTFEGGAAAAAEQPTVREATCRLRATTGAGGGAPINGLVRLTATGATGADVTYFVGGLGNGTSMSLSVRSVGDVSDRVNGARTGSAYLQLGGSSARLADDRGVAAGFFSADEVALNGADSVIGRALVLTEQGSSAVLAQCVIGTADFGPDPVASEGGGTVQYVLRAEAELNAPGWEARGLVQVDRAAGDARVRYALVGLPAGDYEWTVREKGSECPAASGSSSGAAFAATAASGLGSGTTVTVGADGAATGSFVDAAVELSGADSVVGRSVRLTSVSTGDVVAHGVLGRALEHATAQQVDRPAALSAGCRFHPTANDEGLDIDGFVALSRNANGDLQMKYEVRGLAPNSSHAWHIHEWGRTLDAASGLATGGHFVGSCTDCRPGGLLQEVGLIGDGAPITADAYGTAYGVLVDPLPALEGFDGVVGRSFVVHDNAAGGSRHAACVIGTGSEVAAADPTEPEACAEAMDESNFERELHEATCKLVATEENGGTVAGRVSFTYSEATGNVTMQWTVTAGLSDGGHAVALHRYGSTFAPGEMLRELADAASGPQAAAGAASGTLPNVEGADMWGPDSVVGRSLAVYGVEGDSAAVAALCVVGRNEGEATEASHPLAARRPRVKRAVAALVDTARKRVDEGDHPAGGWVEFVDTDVDDPDAPARVRFHVYGLADGLHNVHVHVAGNVDSDDGLATQGHFLGTCPATDCREAPALDEVGYIGDGYQLDVRDGWATGYVLDEHIRLAGADSVVGRSVIVHGVDPSQRVLQGVIGAVQFAETEPLPPYVELDSGEENRGLSEDEQTVDTDDGPDPSDEGGVGNGFDDEDAEEIPDGVTYVTAATARLQATADAPAPAVAGYEAGGTVDMHLDVETGMVRVTYAVSGLAADTQYFWEVRELGNLCSNLANQTGGILDRPCMEGDATVPCRPEGVTGSDMQKSGYVTRSPVTTDSAGAAWGVFYDPVWMFGDMQSVIGRSVVFYADDQAVVAFGAIGRLEETVRLLQNPPPFVAHASCQLRPTREAEEAGYGDLSGYVALTQDPLGEGVLLEYYVTGAPPGEHGYHVHTWGDLLSQDNGQAVGGHFVGYPPASQRTTGLQEVGNIDNGQKMLASSAGVGYDSFRDEHLSLNGINSVVGRSIIVHGDGTDAGVRVAQCTIGIAGESAAPTPFPACGQRLQNPQQAVCTLRDRAAGIEGHVSFVRLGEAEYRVSWQAEGLPEGDHAMTVFELGNIMTGDESLAGDQFHPLTPLLSVGVGTNTSSGSATDTQLRLTGDTRNIVGRTLVVHETASRSSPALAVCVVGRADESTVEEELPDALAPRKAIVELQTADGSERGGYATFEEVDAGVEVRYFLWGVDGAFDHATHIHQRGDLRDDTGADVGEHFIGTCLDGAEPCRAPPALAEVGYLGDGYRVQVSKRAAHGYFVDTHIKLNGPDSIIGRSMVVHGSLQFSEIMVLMGTVGIAEYGEAPVYDEAAGVSSTDSPKQVTRAVAVVRNTENFVDVSGVFTFEQVPDDLASVRVTWSVFGLLPGAHAFAVHEYGDGCADDASSLGSVASNPFVGEGTLNTDATTYLAQGTMVASNFSLSGTASGLGLAVVVKGVAGDADAAAAAGVIGISAEHPTNEMPATKESRFASCRLQPTWQMTSPGRPAELYGYMYFEQLNSGAGVRVRYQVRNLPAGSHAFHVHSYGDVTASETALATGGHYIGDCTDCRPSGALQEDGLLDDGRPMEASDFGTARGEFVDTEISLTGRYSIIGRSIVIHGDGTAAGSGLRVAQCVVGARAEPASEEDEDVCELLELFRDPSSGESSGASTSTIAIAATASVVGLLVLGGILYVCCVAAPKKTKAKKGEKLPTEMTATAAGEGAGATAGAGSAYASTTGALQPGWTISPTGVKLPPGWEEVQSEEDPTISYYFSTTSQSSVWTTEEMYAEAGAQP